MIARLAPVDGIVIPRSASTTIRYVVLGFFAAAYGVLMIYGWLNSQFGDGGNRDARLGTLAIGILFVVVSIVFAVWQLCALRLRQRMVIGSDRFQMLKALDGVDIVVAEIPFANIAELKRRRTDHGVQVDIRLVDPLDSDTLRPPSHNPFNSVEVDAFSCPILNGFKLRPYQIADELERAISLWRESQRQG